MLAARKTRRAGFFESAKNWGTKGEGEGVWCIVGAMINFSRIKREREKRVVFKFKQPRNCGNCEWYTRLRRKENLTKEWGYSWWLNVSRSRKNYTVENYFSNETRLHSFRRYDKYPTLYIFIFARVIDVNERLIYISYLKRRENFHPRFSRRIIPLVVLSRRLITMPTAVNVACVSPMKNCRPIFAGDWNRRFVEWIW